jgi:ferredoxin/flavodoxin---NADP+ reductase
MDKGLSGFIKNLPLERQLVKAKEMISEGVYVMQFARKHDFLPGQVVGISLDSSSPARLYSICSGKDEDELAILFNIKPDGALSPKLAKLITGDPLFMSRPFGAFLGDEKPAWWIASGTGVAPYRSMLRSDLGHNKILIHGGRTADSFYFQDEMKPLLTERYIRCCSGEKGEGLYNGRLTNWMREQHNLPPEMTYYLCGSAEMVVEVRDILISKGIGLEWIMSEIYF